MTELTRSAAKGHLRLRAVVWTVAIGNAFRPALDGASLDDFRADVVNGALALWECSGCYIITEDKWPRLHVWLVAGKNFNDAAHAINNHLHAFDYKECTLRTRNPASLRMYGFLQPRLTNPQLHEYTVWPF
jgi:hypothetical protein